MSRQGDGVTHPRMDTVYQSHVVLEYTLHGVQYTWTVIGFIPKGVQNTRVKYIHNGVHRYTPKGLITEHQGCVHESLDTHPGGGGGLQ